MMAGPASCFYLQKPIDKYWNTRYPDCDYVIEARPVTFADVKVEANKTDHFVRAHLIVINPKSMAKKFVETEYFVKYEGPARPRNALEFISLYHIINPNHQLPPEVKIKDGNAVQVD